jgi:hypothetical protein
VTTSSSGHWLVTLAGVVSAAAWLTLCWASHQAGPFPLPLYFACMAVAWAAAIAALRSPYPATIVAWAVAFRVIGLFSRPLLDDDWFRYVWDGWRFAVSGNPYTLPPSAFFGDPSVPAKLIPVLDGLNHPHLPTIYGPVTEFCFLVSHWVAPGELWPWKLILFAAEASCAVLLVRRSGNWRAVALLLWCPLAIHETAFSAHPDALAAALAAIGVFASGALTGALLIGLALASKATALLLVPVWLARNGRNGVWTRAFLSAIVAATVVLASYLPFGRDALRSLDAMRGFEFNSSIFAGAAWAVGPSTAFNVCAVTTVVLACVLACRSKAGFASVCRAASLTLGSAFLLSPVVNPWYLLWLLPFAQGASPGPTFTALAAVSLSYCYGLHLGRADLGPYGHPAWVRAVEYGAILAALLLPAGWFRWSVPICIPRDTNAPGYAAAEISCHLPNAADRIRHAVGNAVHPGRFRRCLPPESSAS